MKKIILIALAGLILVGGGLYFLSLKKIEPMPDSQSAVINGDKNSAPSVQDMIGEIKKPESVVQLGEVYHDMIRLDLPLPGSTVKSPLIIKGQARGNWFFEASFPVVLTDWDGLIIAQGIATAQENWMTEEFVPFAASLEFKVAEDIYSRKGSLILQKDNPSSLPEYDDALEITLIFE